MLLLALLAGALTIDRTDGVDGLAMFVMIAVILPPHRLTAISRGCRSCGDWTAARPG